MKDCTRCSTPNDDVRKYCRSCGTPLGRHCDRCGTVNMGDDQYCGVCGFALIPSLKTEMNPDTIAGVPRQYSKEDIEELLLLRKLVKPGQDISAVISQGEIDDLFG